jgi:hypothetical protein
VLAGVTSLEARVFVRERGGLRDIYPDICRSFAAGDPLTFSRFGDGELLAILGREGANCDGHRYFPDMGRRLRGILAGEPRYTLGTLPQCLVRPGLKPAIELAPGVRWVSSLCLHDALLDGRFGEFFEALSGRRVVLVGPPHLRKLADDRSWTLVEIPLRNCWLRYESTRDALLDAEHGSDTVFLFCASMMSNVLIDDLYRFDPTRTYIDVGSALDPFAGVHSRPYHRLVQPA